MTQVRRVPAPRPSHWLPQASQGSRAGSVRHPGTCSSPGCGPGLQLSGPWGRSPGKPKTGYGHFETRSRTFPFISPDSRSSAEKSFHAAWLYKNPSHEAVAPPGCNRSCGKPRPGALPAPQQSRVLRASCTLVCFVHARADPAETWFLLGKDLFRAPGIQKLLMGPRVLVGDGAAPEPLSMLNPRPTQHFTHIGISEGHSLHGLSQPGH
ncbi:uncharacterized protein LOC116539928 [Sapajus apella]|uniref:Uncharacterized protein LOC116539928 n=1 Tax=Sapajus apella TaxID=9515 RepID=A0A6J3GMB9_SAPAP|nr:uncharacterized protein LOC116539928 [Sapajus apella]